MNTFSDTDEGRARPSVWPVYLAAGVVGVFALAVFFFVVFPYCLLGALGVVTAGGSCGRARGSGGVQQPGRSSV